MREKTAARAPDYGNAPRPLKDHAVYRTPGLRFRPLPIAGAPDDPPRVPEPGELHLWRFRPQWNATAQQALPRIVSDSEQRRARRGCSRALSKRYLTGRALLRSVLSGMLDCAPGHLLLRDSADGQPELLHPVPSRTLTLQVAYAGVWILVGIAATEFGLRAAARPAGDRPRDRASSIPPGAADTTAIATEAAAIELHDRARRTTAAALSGSPSAAPLSGLIDEESGGGWRHVIDLPMPGRLGAAVATNEPVSSILAYGWGRN